MDHLLKPVNQLNDLSAWPKQGWFACITSKYNTLLVTVNFAPSIKSNTRYKVNYGKYKICRAKSCDQNEIIISKIESLLKLTVNYKAKRQEDDQRKESFYIQLQYTYISFIVLQALLQRLFLKMMVRFSRAHGVRWTGDEAD